MKRMYLFAISSMAMVVSGCGTVQMGSSKPPAESRVLIVCADMSGSVSAGLKEKYFKLAMPVVKKQQAQALIYGFVFAKQPALFYQNRVTSAEQFGARLRSKVVEGEAIPGIGTFYGPTLEEAAKIAGKSGLPTTVIFLSDGDFKDDIATKVAVAKLQSIANVQHLIVGPVYDKETLRQKVVDTLGKTDDPNWLLTAGSDLSDVGNVYSKLDTAETGK